MKNNSRIKIVFHLDSINLKTMGLILHLFYYKNESETLFFKSIEIEASTLKKSDSTTMFEHMEKYWDSFENILYLNQYKCTKNDIEKSFKNSIYNSTIDDFTNKLIIDKKNELLSTLRKNKIDNIFK